jgi:hypothetical protein
MAWNWLVDIKDIADIITSLRKLVKTNRAMKDLLIRELKLNIMVFETASKGKEVNYDKLLDLLNNQRIKEARESRFSFLTIKSGNILEKDIKDKRNMRYVGKNCEWLFKNVDEKIEGLRIQKSYFGSLESAEKSKIGLQFSNLFYKMKLLAEFISE